MRYLVATVVSCLMAGVVLADIQAPPASDYGPTRKLGRGLNNVMFAPAEVVTSIFEKNFEEGNSSAFSYGIVRGVGRMFARIGYGFYEVVTFRCPTYRDSYKPPYRSNIPWLHSGYSEFAPELGWETRYNYCRDSQRSPAL